MVAIGDPVDEQAAYWAVGCELLPGAVLAAEPYLEEPSVYAHVIGISPSTDPIDCNVNGVCDGLDLAEGSASDCNGNGVLDVCDIAGGGSQDVDGNGVPDDCEDDCDGDALPDAWEFATGSGFDCNGNGRLDNCDIAAGHSPDSDGDGVPDECTPGFIITVAADGSGVVDTVQAALRLSVPGSRIEVQPGVYHGPIVLPGHDVELVGVGGAAATVMEGLAGGYAVLVGVGAGPDTVLEELTIRASGGGVLIASASPTLRACVIEACDAYRGGGVHIHGGSPVLHDVTLRSNTADRGGGLWLSGGSVVATDCTWSDNESANGGGGACIDGSWSLANTSLEASGCVLRGNISLNGEDPRRNGVLSGGGGVLAFDAELRLDNCEFQANTAVKLGGGIQATGDSSALITNCVIRENVAGISGGGIASPGLDGGLIEVAETGFCGNTPNDIVGPYEDLGGNLFETDCDVPCFDVDGDGAVGAGEILNVIDHWGVCDSCEADLDGDGVVGVNDLLFVVSMFGPCE